ncbi:hypothetical protein ABTH92_21050, partial [Acinetobacter baumannii]
MAEPPLPDPLRRGFLHEWPAARTGHAVHGVGRGRIRPLRSHFTASADLRRRLDCRGRAGRRARAQFRAHD